MVKPRGCWVTPEGWIRDPVKPRRVLGETQRGFGKTQRWNPEGVDKTQRGLGKTQRGDLGKTKRGWQNTTGVWQNPEGRLDKTSGGIVKPKAVHDLHKIRACENGI